MAWTDICAVVDINARRTPPAACCAAVEVLLHQSPFPQPRSAATSKSARDGALENANPAQKTSPDQMPIRQFAMFCGRFRAGRSFRARMRSRAA
jgi:hypothetical protein